MFDLEIDADGCGTVDEIRARLEADPTRLALRLAHLAPGRADHGRLPSEPVLSSLVTT
jgi:hypothetical protein